jgi:membrane-anchored mycosin MYCP
MTEKEFTDNGRQEIVVDLPYVELVADRIRRLGGNAKANKSKTSTALGLGVVTVEEIEVLSRAVSVMAKDENEPPREPPRSNLDVILIELRRQFRASHGEWMPDMGKNRTIRGVYGAPHIGGSGYPVEATAPSLGRNPDDPEARIGLIDTKVYPNEQFAGRVITIGDSLFPSTGPFTQLGTHGTFTMGRIFDRAPGATVLVEAVLSDKEATSTVWEVATAMARFADRDVSVLVLPLVTRTNDGEPPLALRRAVDLLHDKVVVLAATGNHGEDTPHEKDPGFPAAVPGAVAVGATNKAGDELTPFTPKAPWISLVGPGDDVVSTSVRGLVEYKEIDGYGPPPPDTVFAGGAKWSGTSFAAATLGGEIAAQTIPGRRSAFEVLEKLREQDPRTNRGIGGYKFVEADYE